MRCTSSKGIIIYVIILRKLQNKTNLFHSAFSFRNKVVCRLIIFVKANLYGIFSLTVWSVSFRKQFQKAYFKDLEGNTMCSYFWSAFGMSLLERPLYICSQSLRDFNFNGRRNICEASLIKKNKQLFNHSVWHYNNRKCVVLSKLVLHYFILFLEYMHLIYIVTNNSRFVSHIN